MTWGTQRDFICIVLKRWSCWVRLCAFLTPINIQLLGEAFKTAVGCSGNGVNNLGYVKTAITVRFISFSLCSLFLQLSSFICFPLLIGHNFHTILPLLSPLAPPPPPTCFYLLSCHLHSSSITFFPPEFVSCSFVLIPSEPKTETTAPTAHKSARVEVKS